MFSRIAADIPSSMPFFFRGVQSAVAKDVFIGENKGKTMMLPSALNLILRGVLSSLGVLALLVATSKPLQAQTTISWFTVDGGGGSSQGGAVTVTGTIGQPDAGLLSSGEIQIQGGFWFGVPGVGIPTPTFTPTATLTPTATFTPTITPSPLAVDHWELY